MPSPSTATALPAGWGTWESFPLGPGKENSPPQQDLYESVTDFPHSATEPDTAAKWQHEMRKKRNVFGTCFLKAGWELWLLQLQQPALRHSQALSDAPKGALWMFHPSTFNQTQQQHSALGPS